AVGLVQDGDRIGFGGGNALWRRPLAVTRELVRAGARDLRVCNMIGGLEIDMLLGAGCVAETNCCHLALDEFGQSEHLQRAARDGSVQIREWSEFTFVAALRAAGMGLSFLPWRTAWGSDVARLQRWATVTCPYEGTEMLAVPALDLDVAVIHAVQADAAGNVALADPPDFIHDYDLIVARAARCVIVSAERVAPIEDATRIALIGREVDCVVEAPHGAWPGGVASQYGVDGEHMGREYVPATASPEAFRAYLGRFVHGGEPA
ncbi:MAG: CoA transferase subunit A, partial [Thermoleophilia bacterium]|nr:CoA transferase subunit A [Thermoleophilia bacterium]